MQLLVGC